ncbi:MAG TPA: HTTM domain-containing protein [Planctomycetaceae bacterium]|nr:HTTM domain-containing protein [Planctomycetaceae bacterium]
MHTPTLKACTSAIDRFFMSPGDLRILNLIRPLFGTLLLINLLMLWPDRHMFYGPGSTISQEYYESLTRNSWSMFHLLPWSSVSVDLYLGVLIGSLLLLICGIWSRLAALVVFVLLTGLYNGNSMIFDGEDTVFRLFAFFMIFVPGPKSVRETASEQRAETGSAWPVWPLRMFQLQMCLMYYCCALQKMKGEPWTDGTALYYVFRLYDFYRVPMPDFMTENLFFIKLLSWSVIAIELSVPFLIWFKETRLPTLVFVLVFHVILDLSLNLFLFHWIMIAGWLSFASVDDLRLLRWSYWKKPVSDSTAAQTQYA